MLQAYAIDELSFELGHHEYKDFLSRLKRGRKMFAELKFGAHFPPICPHSFITRDGGVCVTHPLLSAFYLCSPRRSLSPKRNLITYIISKHSTFLHPDVQLYFRDVLDHVARDMERLDFSHDLLNQAQTNFNSNAQWEVCAHLGCSACVPSRPTTCDPVCAQFSSLWMKIACVCQTPPPVERKPKVSGRQYAEACFGQRGLPPPHSHHRNVGYERPGLSCTRPFPCSLFSLSLSRSLSFSLDSLVLWPCGEREIIVGETAGPW